MMLSGKLALISHTLEVNSPHDYPYHEQLILTKILNVFPLFKYTQQFTTEALQLRPTLTMITNNAGDPAD